MRTKSRQNESPYLDMSENQAGVLLPTLSQRACSTMSRHHSRPRAGECDHPPTAKQSDLSEYYSKTSAHCTPTICRLPSNLHSVDLLLLLYITQSYVILPPKITQKLRTENIFTQIAAAVPQGFIRGRMSLIATEMTSSTLRVCCTSCLYCRVQTAP